MPGRAPFSGEAACGALVQNTARNDECETVCSCLCIHQCVFDACVSLIQLPELPPVHPPTARPPLGHFVLENSHAGN